MISNIQKCVEAPLFQRGILTLIIINALILGLETSDSLMRDYGAILRGIDAIILKIFIIEIMLRIIAYRLSFFTRPWSLFDLFVVGIALVPATEAFAALRALRVLRVLRVISAIPSMRKVIEGLLSSIPGIISVSAIMVLIFYVFAVIGTHLYSDSFPQWFGTLGKTMYSLFQIMTLESWSMGIVRPVMEQHPNAWAFFVIYILVTTFTMLNLFIAIIVNAMHESADESAAESREAIRDDIKKSLQEMETRLLAELQKNK